MGTGDNFLPSVKMLLFKASVVRNVEYVDLFDLSCLNNLPYILNMFVDKNNSN